MVRMNRAAVGGNNHRWGLPFCAYRRSAALQMHASSADLQQSLAEALPGNESCGP